MMAAGAIMSRRYVPSAGYNDRAQYFFDQLSSLVSVSLGATMEGHINDYFDELITKGIIDATDTSGTSDKFQCLHFGHLGSANATKLNALRPLDTDAAFRLTYAGGWTYNATGAQPNGTTAYADPHYNPYRDATLNGYSFGIYSRTNDKSGTQVYGCWDGAVKLAQQNFSNENMFSGDIAALLSYSRTTTQRLFFHTRRSSTDSESYQDGTSIGTNTNNAMDLPNLDFYWGARNTPSGAALFTNHEWLIIVKGNVAFSDTEVADFNTATNNFATAIGANV